MSRISPAALRAKLLVSISISGRWPRRLVSATVATASGWAVLQLTGYKTVSVLIGAGSGMASLAILQWSALVHTRRLWLGASDIVAMVLEALKDEAAGAEPQRHSTPVNLALLYRVQKGAFASSQAVDIEGGSHALLPYTCVRPEPIGTVAKRESGLKAFEAAAYVLRG